MRFYRLTTFLFPRSFRLRIFAICFVGTHLPLISFLVWQATTATAPHWSLFMLLLIATLFGTGAALIGIGALLAPIVKATEALTRIERREPVQQLEPGGRDLVGQLINGVNNAAEATDLLITRLDDAASRDLLTGLKNRRGFLDRTAPVLRHHPWSTIALIDIDRFKEVNDRLGHSQGDLILSTFARTLKDGVRQGDFVARWGGEEFAILFPGTDPASAMAILERIKHRLVEEPAGLLDGKPVTFSGGIASIGLEDLSIEAGLSRADGALYRAKRAGRDVILTADDP